MKRWHSVDAGLLALRIGVGITFIATGWAKATHMAGMVNFFGTPGFSPFWVYWAYLATAVELVGGIMFLLGIYARVAAKLLGVVMIMEMYTLYEWGNPVQALIVPFSLLASSVALFLAGSGKYSIKE